MEEASKTAVVVDRPSIGKAVNTSSYSGGSACPSIHVLGTLEVADPIKVSFDLSP